LTGYILYGSVGCLFLVSLIIDRKRTWKALVLAARQFMNMLPLFIALFLFAGITLAVLDPALISSLIGEASGLTGVAVSLIIGSVAFMPSIVSFPLAGSFLEHGAGYPQVAAFISTLLGVGITTLPVEISFFGARVTVLRNTQYLLASVALVFIVWRVMT
jgi:uncharacterized membrane protein YraQ (UPF0718 family)